MRLRIADLFCGAGGAAMGLHRAGFEVVGFDIKPQPRYPFEFREQDALTVDLSSFDAVWASPPCQRVSRTKGMRPENAVLRDLLAPTRELISSLPYIIENPPPALLRDPVQLCGLSFGLLLLRHRLFESSIELSTPSHPRHIGVAHAGVGGGTMRAYSSFASGADYICVAGHRFPKADGEIAMGIDWMTHYELTQAVPPAYSEYLGRQLRKLLPESHE